MQLYHKQALFQDSLLVDNSWDFLTAAVFQLFLDQFLYTIGMTFFDILSFALRQKDRS